MKKISLLILFTLFTTYLNFTFSFNFKNEKPLERMGMGYYIYADKETLCELDFPEWLSFFFEQISGYGEQSEVAQVSKILNIDLSAFQNYDYGTEDKEEEKKFWQDINEFEKVIDSFIEKINKNPNYYKFVRYNKNKELLDKEFRIISEIKDSSLFIKELDKFQNHPDYLFPADYEYLKSGRIKDDLKSLKRHIDCLKKSEVKKIKLMYM